MTCDIKFGSCPEALRDPSLDRIMIEEGLEELQGSSPIKDKNMIYLHYEGDSVQRRFCKEGRATYVLFF